ncbi:hypothetical protein WMC73_24225, partial [Citrobacter braakii]
FFCAWCKNHIATEVQFTAPTGNLIQHRAAKTQEMLITGQVWRVLGRKAFSLLLYPVVGVYWLSASTARKASQRWISRVRAQL